MTSADINSLFPSPTHIASKEQTALSPHIWPGVSRESTETLRRLLWENHQKYHVFFNEMHYHNHIAHALITLWCLGADTTLLEASFQRNSPIQLPVVRSPSIIDQRTWKNHLGDERYYQAYLSFFIKEIEARNVGAVLEEYFFTPEANFVEGEKDQPQMLSRLFGGLGHPMIHLGLGVEFGLPGIVAEGMAQAAVHGAELGELIPPELFWESIKLSTDDTNDTHAFNVLASILEDPKLQSKTKPAMFYSDAAFEADVIKKHLRQWKLNVNGDLDKKVRELLWTNTIIYAVAGFQGHEFNADFFFMHLVTSSIFLSSIFSLLKPTSRVLYLRGYFSMSMRCFIGRGCPELDFARFFSKTSTHPSAPGPKPTPFKDASPSATSPYAITPNPWLQIIQSTLTHPDDHLCKLQRALSEYGRSLGDTPAGTFKNTNLRGAELIDGTLFIRAAGLTATRLGWVREGDPSHESIHNQLWDRKGFFDVARL